MASRVAAALALLACAEALGPRGSPRGADLAIPGCMQRHREGPGGLCGIAGDGAHVCDPARGWCSVAALSYTGTCVALGPAGSPCQRAEQCQRFWEGARCEGGNCTGPAPRVGEACVGDSDCRTGHCSQLKVCAAPEYSTAGENCSLDGSLGLCHPGLQCVDDACVQPKANGTFCSADEECRGFCSENRVCIEQYVQPTGAPCRDDSHCQSGICLWEPSDPRNTSGVCRDPPPEVPIRCRTSGDCPTAYGARAYACECDVERQGWYCRRRWTQPDYGLLVCLQSRGAAECEQMAIDAARQALEGATFDTASAAGASAVPAALLAAAAVWASLA
eukprot:m51a1_g4691 hypothetical protein (333) ;mRNA; f:194947-196364